MNLSQNEFNNDRQKINDRTLQWKMNFNLDPNKQAEEAYFPGKIKIDNCQNVKIKGYNNGNCSSQKYFVLALNENLKFNEHIQSKIIKCHKIIGMI